MSAPSLQHFKPPTRVSSDTWWKSDRRTIECIGRQDRTGDGLCKFGGWYGLRRGLHQARSFLTFSDSFTPLRIDRWRPLGWIDSLGTENVADGFSHVPPWKKDRNHQKSHFSVPKSSLNSAKATIDRLTDRQEDFLMTVLICQPFGNCYWKWWFMDRLGIVGYVSNTCNGLKLRAADHTYFCLSLPNRGTMHAGLVLGGEFFGCTWLKLRPAESDPATKASCASWSCSCFSKE